MKTLLKVVVFVLAVFSTSLSIGQIWQAPMGGSSSGSPSPGNGLATIELAHSTLTTTIYFGGLDSNPTQVFILCCNTKIENAGRAMKALSAVLGPDYGDSNVQYNTDDRAIWEDDFIGAGTTAQAKTKLLDGLQRGWAHIVVYSEAYPYAPSSNGEISGRFGAQIAAVPPRIPTTVEAQATPFVDSGVIQKVSPGFATANAVEVPKGDTVEMQAAASVNSYTCNAHSDRCVIPIYVSSDSDNKTCEARLDYGKIIVPKPKGPSGKIRIVWQLVEGNLGDTGNYRFASNGVTIPQNDVSKDFNGKSQDSADGKRYRWVRVGKNKKVDHELDYTARVERIDAMGNALTCYPADPRIVNRN